MELVKNMLLIDEGLRLKPYRDTVGKLTIGVGRNLDDVGITEEEALYLLENDIQRAVKDATEIFGTTTWLSLDEIRQAVIIDMLFNLGKPRFLTFRKFIQAVKEGDFERASKEMLNSRWARQVGKRAERLAYMMRRGEIHPDYQEVKSVT
ncbi:glycoside hydrolase family protein [Thermovibrio ammonificans]